MQPQTLGDEIGAMDPERMKQWEKSCAWTHLYASKIGATDSESILQATERVVAERDTLRARVAELEAANTAYFSDVIRTGQERDRYREMLNAALDDNWEDIELTAYRIARSGWKP